MTPNVESNAAACPCGRSRSLDECCRPHVEGKSFAPDPESLMRSRYTAFALGTPEAIEYLVVTHHPDFRGSKLHEGLRASIAGIDAWEQLEVRSSSVEGDHGSVEFVATYRVGSERNQLREHSSFVRENGRWLYTQGVIR